MKAIDPAAIAALESGKNIVTGAVAFYTEPDPAFVWGGYGSLTIAGDTYIGIGDHGSVAPLAFEIGGVESGLQLTLSGINPEILALVEAEDVRGKSVVIRRLIFDGTGTSLLDASVFFRGRCDATPIKDVIGGASEITFEIEGSARGLNRSGARLANHEDQLLIDPLDHSFKSIATVPNKSLYWMGKPPERAGQVTNGGYTASVFGRPITAPKLPVAITF